MRTLALVATALAFVACVSAPPIPDFDGDPDTEPTDLCIDKICTVPPADFLGNINLLPVISADVDGENSADLIIGNSPEDARFWGFLLVADVADQTDQLSATPFRNTERRPSVIHVEEASGMGDRAKVFVFGDLKGELGITIYEYSNAAPNRFLFVMDIDGIELPPTAAPEELASAAIAVGQFDDTIDFERPDVVVSCADKIFGAACNNSAGVCEFSEIANVRDTTSGAVDQPPLVDGKNVRWMEARPSIFASGMEIIGLTGVPLQEDLFIAGDGTLRRMVFATANDASGLGWQTLSEYIDFNNAEGVMGDMSAGTSAELVAAAVGPDNRRDLVFVGPGNIDVTSVEKAGMIPQAVERYGVDPATFAMHSLDDPQSPQSAVLGTNRAIVFVDVPEVGISTLHVLLTHDSFELNPSPGQPGFYFPSWYERPLPRGGATSLKVDQQGRIIIFYELGHCDAWELVAGDPTTIERIPAVSCLQ